MTTTTTADEYPGENGEYHYTFGDNGTRMPIWPTNSPILPFPAQNRQERSGYQEFEDGALTPKGIQSRNRHILAIEEQNRVIRRRNETIARLQEQLSEYAAQLESVYESDAFPFKPLRDLQCRIGEANAAKGFHRINHFEPGPDDVAIADYATARLALITTEVAEAIEHLRDGRAVDEVFYEETEHGPKPDGVAVEVIDVIVRAFDFLHEFGVDGAALLEKKLKYNTTRLHRHGKEF